MDTTTLATPQMVRVNMQYSEVTGELWLIYKGARPSESRHLLPRKLSEFYAFDKRVHNERKAASTC